MRMTVLAIPGFTVLSMMSCMVVVNEDDGRCDKNTDGDTVTIIFSQVPAGITSPVPFGR